MNNAFEYKGYVGKFEYTEGDDSINGVVLNIRDVVHFSGKSLEELRQSFEDSVDDYLDWCAKEGRDPDKPFTGKFVLRIDPELHRRISVQAQATGKSLNAWVSEVLENKTHPD